MIPFTKMQGIGNDFVMLDLLRHPVGERNWSELSRILNDRRFGIGGDGLILVEVGSRAPFRMRMFNPDGSESEMCGNGIRCFAKLLRDHGHLHGTSVDVETGAGLLNLELTEDGQVRVDMGLARLSKDDVGMTPGGLDQFLDEPILDYRGTAVSMGNPHLVVFTDDVAAVDLERAGPELERYERFPKRTNVHFVQVVSPGHLIQRTWERGAGITLACGTGACAVAVAAALTGRAERKVDIDLPGGRLQIEYLENGHVMMTGPAETVFTGEIFEDHDTQDGAPLDLAGIREVELLGHN